MSKPIFGLFDNQKDLEAAAAKLHKLGLEQLEIVDQERIEGAVSLIPGVTPMQLGASPGTLVAVPSPMSSQGDQVDSITSYLEELDFDKGEARFAAQALKRGGSLIVIDVEDDEGAREARQIMQQANAVQVV